MRILVTGSRNWTDPTAVLGAIVHVLKEKGRNLTDDLSDVTVVHGECPTGADAFADMIARSLGMSVERHPALWNLHGKKAGPIRNQQMVDLGADICLAFPKGESRGTRDCAKRAHDAGIEVFFYVEA